MDSRRVNGYSIEANKHFWRTSKIARVAKRLRHQKSDPRHAVWHHSLRSLQFHFAKAEPYVPNLARSVITVLSAKSCVFDKFISWASDL
jgi:hypothetical protein